MDFASLMSKELARGSPVTSKAASSTTTAKNAPTTNRDPTESTAYLKKGEVEKQREEAYLKEQESSRIDREEKAKRKRQIEEDEATRRQERDEKRRRLAEESRKRREEEEAKKERARRKRLGLPEIPSSASKEEEGDGSITTTAANALQTDTSLSVDSDPVLAAQQKDLPIPTTLLLLPESSLRVPSKPPPKDDPSSLPYLYRQLTSYFTLLLRAWRDALASRPASVSSSSSGKQALAAYTSSLTNLRPLFTHFERSSLPHHLLAPLLEIVSAAQERRYVDANDAYLRLSIGKAAWPIGVTMVGIHERSAREKLSEGKSQDAIAHIMADEGTRKWLQSLKRCLSFAQTRWPPEDVGQMMG